jgi:DnaJ-class molecular chaperone
MPGGGRGRGGRRKGEDVVHPLKVSLEELYNGTTKKLSLAKNVICSKCDGCAARCAAAAAAGVSRAPRSADARALAGRGASPATPGAARAARGRV